MIINHEIEQSEAITEGLSCRILTYGLDDTADYCAKNIAYDAMGCTSFDFYRFGEFVDHITLSVTGDHNVSNALAAIAAGELTEVPMEAIKNGLLSFKGTDRRFEYKGEKNGITIIDDYAHHPTEIKATLTSVKHYPHRETWCIFQPHTYTRTKAFFHEFAEALSLADHIILVDIFACKRNRYSRYVFTASCRRTEEIRSGCLLLPKLF